MPSITERLRHNLEASISAKQQMLADEASSSSIVEGREDGLIAHSASVAHRKRLGI